MRVQFLTSATFFAAGLSVSCCTVSFSDRLSLISKDTNRNEKAIESTQQTVDLKIKTLSSTVNAIRYEMWQPIGNGHTEIVVPSRTNVEPLITKQQTWRDKFSDTVPKTFAPD
jgi:hypothetical protein